MQLNLTTDYAIRVILYLAQQDKVTNSTKLAEAMYISQKYIVNIIQKLKAAGLVVTYPGIKGGYRLGREPSEISMLDIITIMEGTTKINRCLEEDAYCSRFATDTCPVRQLYVNIQMTLESELKETTIAHMIKGI